MLDARKATILRKIVTEYIETGQPVGSGHVVRDPEIEVSPATVRTDMAALEREGYLVQPHTSAGRIPTDKGYRFFVDQLAEPGLLDPRQARQVQDFFARAHGEIEQMLRETTGLLSRLTSSAAVVVGPPHDSLVVRDLLCVRLSPQLALLVVVRANGVVDKHPIEIDELTEEVELDQVVAQLRSELPSGTTPGQTGRPVLDRLLARCRQVLASSPTETGPEAVYVGGTARMAEQFAAVDTVRSILTILEESFVVVTLLRDLCSQGHAVSIGTENQVESLAECSLVVAPYEVDSEVVGTIGILGPTRMNYPQALAAVALVSERLSRQLTTG